MKETSETIKNWAAKNKEHIRKALILIIIGLITLGGVKLMEHFKKEPQINELGESIKLIKTRKVKLDTNTITVAVYGNLKSRNEIDIFPEVGGKLWSDNFREGNTYKNGEVIAVIDNRELANTVKSQKSNLLNQVAKLVADLKFDFPDAVAEWEAFLENIVFDAPLPDLPIAKNVKLKKYLAGKSIYNSYFAIQAQEERLSKYNIAAPFDGVLTEALIKPGTVIRPGQKIGRFINPTHFELEANVSLVDGTQLKIGDRVNLHSNDILGGWKGKVIRINKTLSEVSQNMDVFISVSADNLYNGMYLFGEINKSLAINSLRVNRSLLKGFTIFKVVDDKLQATTIKVLQVKEEYAIISGLKNGDIILGENIKEAYDGMKVRYNN